MFDKAGLPLKNKGISTAGITVRLDELGDGAEPFDITLYIKKPKNGGDTPSPDDDNSFTTTGKLTFRFGKRGSVELFAENISQIDEEPSF